MNDLNRYIGFLGVVVLLVGLSSPATATLPDEVQPGEILRIPDPIPETLSVSEPFSLHPVDLNGEPEAWVAVGLRDHADTGLIRRNSEPFHRFEVVEGDFRVQHITIEDTSLVELSDADLQRAREESARVREITTRRTEQAWDRPFVFPFSLYRESNDSFGARRIINNSPRNPHSGEDYPAPTGTSVLSMNDGTVALVDDLFFAGRTVIVDHGTGLFSHYFHLDEIRTSEGDRVRRGQILGTVGETGRVTGPHLHLGVTLSGNRVDPEQFFTEPLGSRPDLPVPEQTSDESENRSDS